ncbi:MAG: prolyl oligopeptidase family serine peptidase [Candidatus Acidiferrales bacterium]
MSMSVQRLCLAAGFLVLMGGAYRAAAQSSETKPVAPATPAKKSPWKPDDFVYTESASQFRVSPNGKWAVWVKSTPDKDKDTRVSNLILSSLTEKMEIPLTRDTDTVSQPRWSLSGETIAFLSTHALPKPKPENSPTQLWLINAAGGDAWPVTEFAKEIKSFEWIDNDTILFSAEEDASLYEHDTKERKDDTVVVDDTPHAPAVRLFKFAIKDKKVSRVTDNSDWIENFDVSRDGKWAVASASRELSYAWDHKVAPATYLVDLSTGKRTELYPDGKIRPDELRWARDNSGFYAVAPYSSDPHFFTATVEKLYFYDLASSKTTEVNLDWDRYLGSSMEVTSDGFIALLADGVHLKPARYTKNGSTWSREWITGDQTSNYFDFAVGDDGHSFVYNYSTASTPAQWYRAHLDGAKVSDAVPLTDINPQYKERNIAKTEILHWKGANDDAVEGILYYPLNYEPGKRYPLVVATHGGPAYLDFDAWSENWAYSQNLLTQRGALILKTNYHGSAGYGLKWVESICCGKYYDLEIPDIEKGVDNLIAKGLVDPDRIGALGWSNGSILTIQLTVTDPARYKAASVGAGDVEWISDWANVDFGESFDDYYFGKSPLQDPELYLRKSPLFKMDRVRTPTLIFFGTLDRQVPTEQGWTHYRALYSIGKAPVRFLLFPGEAHGPQKLSHQLRKVTEETAWFDKYLFNANPPENEAFKKNSPLGEVLRRQSIKKVGDVYGNPLVSPAKSDAAGAVIPEVVKRGELEIGRFEVTRAQYAAFDKNFAIAAGTENFPANGITLEQAKAYCAWLSQATGETYRLPNEKEVGDLYKDRPGENTLDYWAGYAVNPEDAQRLEEKIKQLPGTAPLLKEAGSFAGQGDDGEELIFDLGGNVAEWAIAADGSGKALGGSADRASDSKARYRPADLAYTGFRVVHVSPKPK